MEEIWKPVAGYEGLYEVSSLGRVRSNYWSPRKKQGESLRGGNLRGYRIVILCKNKKRYTALVHRLVAFAFLGAPPTVRRPTVNHKNLNKSDNRVENLEWLSHADNIRHAAPLIPRLRGEANSSKLNASQVVEMRRLYAAGGITLNQLGLRFNVSGPTCFNIIRRKKWAHIK